MRTKMSLPSFTSIQSWINFSALLSGYTYMHQGTRALLFEIIAWWLFVRNLQLDMWNSSSIDLSRKSHTASHPYPRMHHFVCTSLCAALWDICPIHIVICEMVYQTYIQYHFSTIAFQYEFGKKRLISSLGPNESLCWGSEQWPTFSRRHLQVDFINQNSCILTKTHWSVSLSVWLILYHPGSGNGLVLTNSTT